MIHWLTIIIGIFLLSISISNPVYNLIIKKYFKLNKIVNILLRIVLFIFGISAGIASLWGPMHGGANEATVCVCMCVCVCV